MSSNRNIKKSKPPYFIELSDLKDLARLTCAFEKTPLSIFSFEFNKETYLATQVDIFMDRPIFYYLRTQEVRHLLCYKNSGGVEEALLADSPSTHSFTCASIIHFMRLPKLFQNGLLNIRSIKDKFISIQVKDIISLAKVSTYKMLFGDPPLPLFSFKSDDSNILGTFTRMDESDENSIFFYTSLDDIPPYHFIRYSTIKIGEVNFTNKVDETGNAYIKIITLVRSHPLVEFEK